MNIVKAWQSGINGTGVTICINDPTGIDIRHPDLNGRFVSFFTIMLDISHYVS